MAQGWGGVWGRGRALSLAGAWGQHSVIFIDSWKSASGSRSSLGLVFSFSSEWLTAFLHRYETELGLRQLVEADTNGLRQILGRADLVQGRPGDAGGIPEGGADVSQEEPRGGEA